MFPRVSDMSLDYGLHPMYDVVATFPTSFLFVTLQFHQSEFIKQVYNEFNRFN